MRTEAEIQSAIEQVKAEIIRDQQAGIVPPNVPDFSALHDYVDANTYAGFCDEASRADWSGEDLAKVQSAVNTWLVDLLAEGQRQFRKYQDQERRYMEGEDITD